MRKAVAVLASIVLAVPMARSGGVIVGAFFTGNDYVVGYHGAYFLLESLVLGVILWLTLGRSRLPIAPEGLEGPRFERSALVGTSRGLVVASGLRPGDVLQLPDGSPGNGLRVARVFQTADGEDVQVKVTESRLRGLSGRKPRLTDSGARTSRPIAP